MKFEVLRDASLVLRHLCNPRQSNRAETKKISFIKRTMDGEADGEFFQQYGIRMKLEKGLTSTYLGPLAKAPKGAKAGETVIAKNVQ